MRAKQLRLKPTRWLAALVAGCALTLASQAEAGLRMGALPEGALSRSVAGPSDELVGYIAFDPRLVADQLPAGLRFVPLQEKAEHWPYLQAYLQRHPERAGWVWSYYEVILLRAARYDRVRGDFGRSGGMALWYADVAREDVSDPRPQGDQSLVLGSWISDPVLAAYMRAKGFPAEDGAVTFRSDRQSARGRFMGAGLTIEGACRLEGAAFVPEWAREPVSYQTLWTPGSAETFELVTWTGHRGRNCVDPRWTMTGAHPLARAFNDPSLGDPFIFPTDFNFGYRLQSGFYRR